LIQKKRLFYKKVEFWRMAPNLLSPYDEYAIEEAVKLKDEFDGEVTVLTVGPPRAESALRTALAMGADKAILVDNEELEMDEHSVTKILAAVIKEQPYDIILGGNMAVDNGSGQGGDQK
jgi:electron transfer flavoprotein beta subunit